MISFTEPDLLTQFPGAYIEHGRAYQAEGRVKKVVLDESKHVVTGKVTGRRDQAYRVNIHYRDDPRKKEKFIGSCTCPVAYNCKHVVATLFALLEERSAEAPEPLKTQQTGDGLKDWLKQLITTQKASQSTAPLYPEHIHQRLLYILHVNEVGKTLAVEVELVVARKLAAGEGYGKAAPYRGNYLSPATFLLPDDVEIRHRLELDRRQAIVQSSAGFSLLNQRGAELLEKIINTKRCYWRNKDNPILQRAEEKTGKFVWKTNPQGEQTLEYQLEGVSLSSSEKDAFYMLPLDPPWYVLPQQAQIGRLRLDMPSELLKTLLAIPVVEPEQVAVVQKALKNYVPDYHVPLPKAFTETSEDHSKPTPYITLLNGTASRPDKDWYWKQVEEVLPLVRLGFRYGEKLIPWHEHKNTFTYVKNGKLTRVTRQKKFEQQEMKKLAGIGIVPLSEYENYKSTANHRHDLVIAGIEEAEKQLHFMVHQLPALREAGWEVNVDKHFLLQIVDEEPEWYTSLDSQAGTDWFGLELGILLGGKKINLLPALVEIIQKNFAKLDAAQIQALADETRCVATLPDGRLLPIPIRRVRGILSVLTELYDSSILNNKQQLALSRLRAVQLLDLESAMGGVPLRWQGSEALLALGKKLRHFSGIQPVAIPKGFTTGLRQYQHEGLNWLQFLREYDLAGILADDMGLGKTVQTLAHLLLEKEQDRMHKPCLIVAPTSLMSNWAQEAKRFAPTLKVLTLHGHQRKRHFDKISQSDIVLTTYPLLARDREVLAAQDFYYLILDEAQHIKNPKALATQMVQQLKAQHRLCLTGTPMENHLGELWSLFNFLMPGLLGGAQQFKRLFRNPIEKQNDEDRRASLSARVAPFMLRRTKQAVLKELPAKTIMVRQVELEGGQRDLYESIRLAMHKKVAQTVSEKGLSRSHIIILDALLKLRQTCCHPQLLNLDEAKAIDTSAKLNLLMEMLPNMIAEGRRILLFSQFTSMLKLIETACQAKHIDYVKLTGQTKDRDMPISRFQAGDVPLFLISLKAGGTGLNLTAADTVIHYDPWWNPAVETQATDRAHRIGQKKGVFVYKLVTTGTVEEKILELQESKKRLVEGLFVNKPGSAATLSPNDLESLFEPLH